ncbi:hypothetical protein KPH14_001613 [Odynerus spinipes]|uniref:NADH dehydrogenase [ubiquinone] 1 alpha subcomplex assembly factor 3 n=1 Tax=Odynerus spinipes TaxID=1348599 RepID=A0AAD9VVP5_9HYME|nr:hypothetical protein KPH14_001613 [Odynerus spinipes]
MRIAFHRLFNPKVVNNLRSLYTSRIAKEDAYDGPGRTTITILNNAEDAMLMIDNYDTSGFLLNNGIKMVGPMIIFSKSLFFWNVGSAKDINKDSLILFSILEPKIDLLILGLEDNYDYKFIHSLKEVLKDLGIKNEICTVDQACTAFNFVNSEGRYAAAALIPPRLQRPELIVPYKTLLKEPEKEKETKPSIDDK